MSQFDNQCKLSTCHYWIKMLHQLYRNADNPKTVSTIVLTDFSKAMDRIDHNILIRKLIQLEVRPCIIFWITSFLECRKQRVKYKGTFSSWEEIGVPQGTK